ncbi:flagellar biosynthesis anti-sigma factor FlgM [Paenibacillus abyssi]|uniref:Negative regulator of flagellin synthesis n=1 Tax=Paenibacillus abyssi TaxID=1340531 RepID=A0A917CKB8_9BACL|nr:flagellar biosynthesis anti-sigma factor FlgM [Paenibacillus abyssi]GGF91549.1 hypothetical protein GCM10010916_06060 [Paenibacillus abyssi]
MKINEPGRISALQKYANHKGTRSGGAETTRRKDEVSISPEAKELLESNRAAQAGRTEKLNELKASVSAGTYHVEAGKLAEKLLPYLK